MSEWIPLFAALATALCSLAGVIWSNRATRKVLVFRVEQLEKKVDKHNQVVERTFKLEQKVDDLEKVVRK